MCHGPTGHAPIGHCPTLLDKLDEPDMEEDSDVNDDTEVNCPAENALEEDTTEPPSH